MRLKKKITLLLICLCNIAFVVAGCVAESEGETTTENVVKASETANLQRYM